MDYKKQSIINRIAQNIIDAYAIEIPITDLNDVVRRMGGAIYSDYGLDEYADGRIWKEGNRFVICVSANKPENRKRFTIAHEIGHLFLHMGYIVNQNLWNRQDNQTYYRNGDSEEEYEANEFAAALLMPEIAYKQILDKYSHDMMVDMNLVAEHFGVSTEAAINRGKWLGYLR